MRTLLPAWRIGRLASQEVLLVDRLKESVNIAEAIADEVLGHREDYPDSTLHFVERHIGLRNVDVDVLTIVINPLALYVLASLESVERPYRVLDVQCLSDVLAKFVGCLFILGFLVVGEALHYTDDVFNNAGFTYVEIPHLGEIGNFVSLVPSDADNIPQ